RAREIADLGGVASRDGECAVVGGVYRRTVEREELRKLVRARGPHPYRGCTGREGVVDGVVDDQFPAGDDVEVVGGERNLVPGMARDEHDATFAAKTHVGRLLNKLNAPDRAQLVNHRARNAPD